MGGVKIFANIPVVYNPISETEKKIVAERWVVVVVARATIDFLSTFLVAQLSAQNE